MNWFQNQKTTTKLFLAFGMMSAIMLVVGWLGVSGMNDINGMVNALYERDMVGLAHLQNAESSFVRVGRGARQTIIETEVATMEDEARLIDKADAEFRKHLDAAETTLVTAEGKAKLAEVRAIYPAYADGVREVVKSALANDNKSAHEKLQRIRPSGNKIEALLVELSASKDRLGRQAYDDSDVVYLRDRKIALSAMGVALLFGITVAIWLGRAIARPLGQAVSVLEAVAGGDFTRSIDIHTNDEVGLLAKALNRSVERMREALEDVRSVAGAVASASQQLSASSTDISSGAQEQAASLEETAASLEEITATVKQNADSAQHAAQLASASRDVAEKGGRVVDAAVSAMSEITTSSKKIAEIITAIDEIAFQTNLLALNAAVEAARAGEQGRGFAVVAAEVRTLAQRSATAAKEIKGLIVDSVDKVDAGSKHVTESGETLHEIVSSVKRVTDMVSEIAAASREQNAAIEQVNTAITQMDQVTQSNASQTEELSATAEQLTQQASQLQSLVARFRLDADSRRSFAAATPELGQPASTAPSRSASRVVAATKRGAPARPSNVAVLRSIPPRRPEPFAPTGTNGVEEF